jgi:hypothetical protein
VQQNVERAALTIQNRIQAADLLTDKAKDPSGQRDNIQKKNERSEI